MAQTLSRMIPLSTEAPPFSLYDVVSGARLSLDVLASDTATVVMFLCNHCPFVKHVNEALVQLSLDYIPKDIAFIAISSNDAANYPEDGPDNMKAAALTLGYPFPYLYDESQEIAKAYDAACTPDFYIFNSQRKLVYRGQLDEARPSNNIPVTANDIRRALDNMLQGIPVQEEQKPSIGCNIKWKK